MCLIPTGTLELQGQAGSSWRGRLVCRPAGRLKQGWQKKAANASHNLPVDSSGPVKRKLIPLTKQTKSLTALPFASFKQLQPMNLTCPLETKGGTSTRAGGCSAEKGNAVRRQKAPLVAEGRSWQRNLWSCNDFHWPRQTLRGRSMGLLPGFG